MTGDLSNTVDEQLVHWPGLTRLRLSQEQLIDRARFIGGSDANVILSGCPERLTRLWREKRGEELPQDLSGNLAVMLGCWSESFNRQWFEKCTQKRVGRVGEVVHCSRHHWRSCTLDGFVEEGGAVWEAKHTSSFVKPEEVLERYMPQLQHSMAVVGAERAYLSVLFGNSKWECFEVASDWLYQADLLEAERAFWDCPKRNSAGRRSRSARPEAGRVPRNLPSGQQFLGRSGRRLVADPGPGEAPRISGGGAQSAR